MKKTGLLEVLIVCVAVMLCACGSTNKNSVNQNEVSSSESVVIETKDTEKTENVTTEKKDTVILQSTYKVPLKEIYIDIPDMHQIEAGYTEVFYEDGVKYVAFTCLKDFEATDEKDALVVTFEQFKLNMSGLDIVNSLGEVSEEYLNINGIDVYCFEGVMSCGSNPIYDAYIKGYSFIYDDIPCSIIGVVMDEEQPQEQIDAVKEIVDAMMLTVRSEK